ncbi:hypothetical protein KR215_006774 [Drosophila sulfurigaster]|nr:hypothetical protein KR215_006774 [Drosophila sulfurigaster]
MQLAEFQAAAVCLCLGLILTISPAQAQENAQLQIPPSLIECYNTSYFMNRDNRLPANMDTLISLIEKVENSYVATGYQMDIRQVSVALLHRFRQDGIKRAAGVQAVSGVIPYSPTGFQFPKLRILLSLLLQGNANTFPNSSLTSTERCSLHFMMSSTFDTRARGDENTVCSQLSQYRAQRLPRGLNRDASNNFIGDAEWLDKSRKRALSGSNYVQFGELDYDTDWAYAGTEGQSQCPVEDGVVRTPWGTVSAGALIAGVATGLQQQNVAVNTLLRHSSQRRGRPQRQTTATSIDNRWAATLGGDLAEVTLVQVPVSTNNAASVGATGGWNDTVLPHWYFLTQRTNLEATDAEIRGGLDGLIIAKNIAQWKTQASSLKLSQLLRMYYSTTGVLGSGITACSRQSQFPIVAPTTEMQGQVSAFAQVLDNEMQLKVTLQPDTIANFASTASLSLVTYVRIMDFFQPEPASDISNKTTIKANVFVFVDTNWPYYWVVDYVSYVLQNLNIHPYGSTVTLFAASDAAVIVNTTDYIVDVYQQWNFTSHYWHPPGFNLPAILNTLSTRVEDLLETERSAGDLGGRSLVALLVPSPISYVDENDYDYSRRYLDRLTYTLPNLQFIYYGGGALVRFHDFVKDPSRDLLLLNIDKTAEESGAPVIRRIRQVPRRISNPRCYSNGIISEYGSNSLVQYGRLGSINFYRLDALYLPQRRSMRYLKISPISQVTFTVCTSRTIELPFRNMTTSLRQGESCDSTALGPYSYDLTDACVGYDYEPCPPLFFSVQSQGFGDISCTQDACQTPDEAQYIISMNNLGCNGASSLQSSLAFIIMMALYSYLSYYI